MVAFDCRLNAIANGTTTMTSIKNVRVDVFFAIYFPRILFPRTTKVSNVNRKKMPVAMYRTMS
jgi:hypothetical protein